ncbi:MAG: DNA polymerase III subunit delta [Sphingomicrobium sp.]
MKANRSSIVRAVEQPDGGTRFYLFYGPDEAQSRALAARLAESLSASRYLISGGSVKSDPALLADEAGAMNLFGGKRLVWIEPAGEDIVEGVSALLELPATESPVVAIAGALRKTSGLLKLAEASPHALACVSYAPEGEDAQRLVMELGRRVGLRIGPGVAARIATSGGNDQAVIAQELEKLSLYLDASPHSPKELDHDAVDAVGAEAAEGNFLRLADLAMSGQLAELTDELARLSAGGTEGVPVVRSLQRRLLMLAPARARIERGERPDAVMASVGRGLYSKEKDRLSGLLSKWSADDLAKVADRAQRLQRDLMFSDAPAREALGEELIAIARKARSL